MCYRFVYITTEQVQEFGTAKTKFAGTQSSQKVQTVRLGTIIDIFSDHVNTGQCTEPKSG